VVNSYARFFITKIDLHRKSTSHAPLLPDVFVARPLYPCTGLKKQPIRQRGRGQLAEPQGRSKNCWYASKVHKMYEYTLLMQTRNFLNVLGARPARPPRAGVWLAFLILGTGIGGWRQKHPAVAVHGRCGLPVRVIFGEARSRVGVVTWSK
jgi:hypothetical protein